MKQIEAADLHINEAQFQQQIIDLARNLGWKIAHFRPAMTSKGYRTPVQGDGKGFPDCVIVGRNRVIIAELKSEKGTVSKEQQDWLNRFSTCQGVETYVWKPSDIDEILKVLSEVCE